MADNTTLNAGTGGDVIASDDIGGVKHQRVKVEFGADGSATDVSSANPLPVSGPLTDAQLRAAALPVTISSPVEMEVKNDSGNPLATTLPYALPAALAANAVFDARTFATVDFQFTSGSVSVTRSLDGTNYVAWPVVDGSGNVTATAPSAGIYGVEGGGYLKFSAAVTVRAGA